MNARRRSIPFRVNAAMAVRNENLREAMRNAAEVFARKRTEAFSSTPFDEWRQEASEIKLAVLKDLAGHVDNFAVNATRAGAIVYRAKDSIEARAIVGGILRDRHVQKVIKSKSMVTEEIGLNGYLEDLGLEVVETDLGEFIIQLAHEHPSHIIVPAIHRTRREVGRIFASQFGIDYCEDPFVLTKIARNILRDHFLSAQAGISGANFAVSESGSVVIFTNEGNGRMVTTLPPIHIVVLTIEKMLPNLATLPKFMRVLPRSATGQGLTSYVSIITGKRKGLDTTGAREVHVVLLDNGRSKVLQGEFFEILKCIRCGACMNVCPVYRLIGGHAYESTYPGPMGIILSTLLSGMTATYSLLDATTLCGACAEVCPVMVPLPGLLRSLRETRVARGFTPLTERGAMIAFALAVRSQPVFRLMQTLFHTALPGASKFVRPLGRLPHCRDDHLMSIGCKPYKFVDDFSKRK